MNSFGSRERRKSSHRRRRPFGKLTIDTKFASQGKTFPYESRVQELSFVSFAESKARKNAFARQDGIKQQLEDGAPVAHEGQQAGPEPVAQAASSKKKVAIKPARSLRAAIVSSPSEQKVSETSLAPPINKRVKGLKPSPLDLSQDVSPSDRAITIGLSLAPSAASRDTACPETDYSRPSRPVEQTSESSDSQKFGHEVATPVIVITPAKDRFSPSNVTFGYRPTSSIYSRFTNGFFRPNEKAPPVPPLPLFAATRSEESLSADHAHARESAVTTFEEDFASPQLRDTRMESTWSADTATPAASRFSKRSTAGLPTPRRSKGWWNVITSPFSAKSSNGAFWKTAPAEQDGQRVLDDAADMGTSDPHAGVIFLNRAPEDDELRSAPAEGPAEDEKFRPAKVPQRSNTAPGAVDPNTSGLNIYDVPKFGEAAAYYDPKRHFPSLYLSPEVGAEVARGGLDGWSPSQSVYIPSRHSHPAVGEGELPSKNSGTHSREMSEKGVFGQGNGGSSSPEKQSVHAPPVVAGANIFSTPSEDELRSAGLEMHPASHEPDPTPHERVMSPLSATPVVQDAHFGRVVGPQSSFGEQREVEVEAAPTPSHYGLGFATLGAATISHREPAPTRGPFTEPQMEEKSAVRPVHARQDSHGLGITGTEQDLYPPPKHLREKPRLGTDKFGQLTVRTWDLDEKPPKRPWYRRFFWLLAAVVATLLLLMIILLVVFVPERHKDMSVQATWVNTTGFPALSTGVSTVIQPQSTSSRSSCVSPSQMWSCAVPGQDEKSLPNFRFEIRFRNGTLPSNETTAASSSKRSEWSSYLYAASPSPPSSDDQTFLGRTTDNTTIPYAGEETPFYISLLATSSLTSSGSSKAQRRDSNFTYPYPTTTTTREQSKAAATTAATSIPSPALASNGEPASQELYPLASVQPLRLYNRGKDDEHYGFYAYFDRSIYLSAPYNASNNATDDFISNVALNNASTVCTFSQTRLRVQIWTKKGAVATISSSSAGVIAAGNSTANDMSAPGSFPYPVTVAIDRHGGKADKKGVYCYGLDENHHVVSSEKMWIAEDRAAGGTIVNPAEVPGNSTIVKRVDQGFGGIDGGTGGCDCSWQNWK